MPAPEIRAFADDDLDAAAALLAARHRRHRTAEPLLSARYEDPAAARAEIERLWREEDSSGAVGVRNGRMVAYVLGTPRDEQVWGSNVWVESAGHAAEAAEDVRDVYGVATARWVEQGRTRQYVMVPAFDTLLVDAWFRLGFGQQQGHGVREPADSEPNVPDGFDIRPPDIADIEQLIEFDFALPRHQQSAPVFGGAKLPSREEARAEWESTLAGADEHILIGYRDGHPVACWSMTDFRHSRHNEGVAQLDRAAYLAFAVTLPEARGSGIGVALTDASLAWAAREGYPAVVTDWRVTNLLASRFWPARGFRPAFLRLYRSIP
jgi:ribosomal protein S18 acetylase RimI-like enzyme